VCVCACVCVCVCACVCVGGQDGVRYSVVAGYAHGTPHAMVLLQGSFVFFLEKLIVLSPDTHTARHMQWFYFKVPLFLFLFFRKTYSVVAGYAHGTPHAMVLLQGSFVFVF
jgi:hypothetical protein